MTDISPRSRFGTLSMLSASLWSFVILPALPAYASFQQPQPEQTLTSLADNQAARVLAGHIQSAGTGLASNGADLSTMAGSQARNALSGAATAEVERWLAEYGTARVRVDVDRNFTLNNSSLDLLIPWYNAPDRVVFTQQSIHRTDDRTQMNLGAGVRHFGSEWMTGANAFYDYDLTRYHSRAGIGAELWRDYLKLGANGYFRLSGWRDAPEMNHDYEARPANGWDIRAEGWLPAYPQVGGKLSVEQYYGHEVALFGRDNRQENPHAITAGVNWTPVPLVTFSAEHAAGKGGLDDSRFGLQLNWTPGMSLARHLEPAAVGERRTLAGSRLDLVERNNNIVLEYRKKELIKLALRERAEGLPGQAFTLVTSLQTKYPLKAIDWRAGEFLAAGGQITGSGTATLFILPAFRAGGTAAETQRLNSYTIGAVARDAQGNVSSRAESVLVVQGSGVQIAAGDLTVSSGAQANGTDTNTATAIVTDGAGKPVPGETVTFTLPAEVTPAGNITRSNQVQVNTDDSGAAVLDIVSLTAGTYTLQATVGTAQAVSASTTFIPDTGIAGQVNLEVTVPQDNAIADGTATNQVKVVVKDGTGAVQANTAVNFSVTPGAQLSATDVVTDSNGTAQVTLTSATAGSYTVTASAGGISRTVTATFAAIRLQGTLTASPTTIMADDTAFSTLTLTLNNQNNAPQPGRAIVFSVSGITGVALSDVTDNGNGTYTATLKGSSAGTADISVMVDDVVLSGVNTSVTLLQQPPLYTLTANTHLNAKTFTATSGFPKTGFSGATFTVETSQGAPSDYVWMVQKQDGGSVSWLSVNDLGIVTFNNEPIPTEKSVEIIATPKSGGQRLGYRFTLDKWFINNGGVRMYWADANDWCTDQSLSLAIKDDVKNPRGTDASLFANWGPMESYSHAGFVNTVYWLLTPSGTSSHERVNLGTGGIDSYGDTSVRDWVMCVKHL